MRNCRLEQFVTNNYDFPLWIFATGYTAFAALILITWIICRPDGHVLGPVRICDHTHSGLFQPPKLNQ